MLDYITEGEYQRYLGWLEDRFGARLSTSPGYDGVSIKVGPNVLLRREGIMHYVSPRAKWILEDIKREKKRLPVLKCHACNRPFSDV